MRRYFSCPGMSGYGTVSRMLAVLCTNTAVPAIEEHLCSGVQSQGSVFNHYDGSSHAPIPEFSEHLGPGCGRLPISMGMPVSPHPPAMRSTRLEARSPGLHSPYNASSFLVNVVYQDTSEFRSAGSVLDSSSCTMSC